MKKVISFVLTLFFVVNIFGNIAYATEITPKNQNSIGQIYLKVGDDDEFCPEFQYFNKEDDGENIEKVKLYTKYRKSTYENLNGDYYNPECSSNLIDSEVFELTKSNDLLNDEEFKYKQIYFDGKFSKNDLDYGVYFPDKIDILFKDGTKKTIYNEYFYNELTENHNENAQFKRMNYILDNRTNISVIDTNIDKIMRLNNEYSYEFTVNNNVLKEHVLYVCLNNETNSQYSKILKAEKVNGKENTYAAKVKFTDSLETGNWYLSRVRIEDSKLREDNIVYGIDYEQFKFKLLSENADAEAPVLKDIKLTNDTFDYNGAKDNEFILDIEDNLSGFSSGRICLKQRDNDTLERYYIPINYDEELDQYKAKIRYCSLPNGEYIVESIYLEDNIGNNVVYSKDKFEHIKLYVINNEEEIGEPSIEILEIKNNTKEITVDDKIDMTVKFRSSDEIVDVYGYARNNMHSIWADIKLKCQDEKEKIYMANISSWEFNKYQEQGTYKFQFLQFKTKNNKMISINNSNNEGIGEHIKKYDFSPLDFKIINDNEDIKEPVIEKLEIKENVLLVGDSTEIIIKARDDKSGFYKEYANNEEIGDEYRYIDRAQGIVYYHCGNNSVTVPIEYDETIDAFRGVINFESYLTTGIYKVTEIGIVDIAGNECIIDYDSSNEDYLAIKKSGTILVKNSLDEIMPPTITSNINDGQVFTNSIKPEISSDHGNVTVLLNNKIYDGKEINLPGNYTLFITATGIDGSVSTKILSFKVISEIKEDTESEDVVQKPEQKPDEDKPSDDELDKPSDKPSDDETDKPSDKPSDDELNKPNDKPSIDNKPGTQTPGGDVNKPENGDTNTIDDSSVLLLSMLLVTGLCLAILNRKKVNIK